MADMRIAKAKEHGKAAEAAKKQVSSHLARRDELIRMAYAEGKWSYSQLAKQLDLTPELIAKIIRPQRR